MLNNPETCTMQRKERHASRKNAGGKRLMVGMQFPKTIPRENTRGVKCQIVPSKFSFIDI